MIGSRSVFRRALESIHRSSRDSRHQWSLLQRLDATIKGEVSAWRRSRLRRSYNARTMRDRFHRHTRLAVLSVFVVLAAAVPAQEAGRLVAVMGITREIAPVEIRLEGASVTNLQGVVFTTGTVDGRRIIAVRSGVGKTNSAMAA